MLDRIRGYFDFEALGTNFRREITAGITTFVSMSYIIAVNPAILKTAGVPPGPSMVVTIIVAIFGTLMMGLYAKRPFAVAPYMGENAFIAFTVVKVLGYRWQTAVGAVFLAGVLFVALTIARVRQWLVEGVPPGLRYAFAVGIGLFLAFIGLNEAGIVAVGVAGAPVKVGAITSAPVMVAIGGFLLISALMVWRVPAAILIGIIATTFVAYFARIASPPASWMSLPPSPAPLVMQLDISGAFSWGFFGVLLSIFMMAFVDTMGTLVGLSARAGFLDEHGNLPQIERPMLTDALSTTLAGLLGTSTAGAFIESAVGIDAGGRSGFTAVVTAALFAMALFFSPFVVAIPAQAYSPALIVVGLLMLAPITKIDFSDYTELIPAFTVVALISFTYNIGIGVTGGFVLYPFFKVISGRHREVRPGLWVLSLLSLLFFIFYPYT